MSGLLPLGRISKPHGLKGEIKVFFYGGKLDIITRLERLFVYKKKLEKPLEFKITSLRIQNDATIIGLEGINTIEEASELNCNG